MEKRLRDAVLRGGAEKHARRIALPQPADRRLHQLRGNARPAERVLDCEVVNEARGTAKLLPRQRLQSDVDVSRNRAVLLRDEDHIIRRLELPAEKRGVAAFRPLTRREKTLRIERVVRAHEHRAETAENVRVARFGFADEEGRFHWLSAPDGL